MDIKEIQNALYGPMPSFRTPFTKDGEIDWKAIPQVLEAALAGNPKCLALTAGDSHFECMSNQEIAEVTKRVCEIAVPRTMVITADLNYATARAREFAEFCRSCGSKVFMPLPPDWQKSTSQETLAQHYAAVAEILPVMIVTNRFRLRGDAFGLATMHRALDLSPRIISIKEDNGGRFACDVAEQFGDRCAVIAGGSKRLHLLMRPFGRVASYFSIFMCLKPELAWAYWNHCEEGRIIEAEKFFREVESPLFNACSQQSASIDASFHAIYEIYGICGRWRRAPYTVCSDEDVDRLRAILADLSLLPN